MKVTFTYDAQKDLWCVLNKGKTSLNSQHATKQYEGLVAEYGENFTPENAAEFIDSYISSHGFDVGNYIDTYQKDWDSIAVEFQSRAEALFKTTLPESITGYLTINSRCPYSITNNYFFVAMPTPSSRRTAMHELWHFYTWHAFGVDQEEKLGKQKYNEIKESLTVLLNIECADLLPPGIVDAGYPQHQELRGRIVEFWNSNKDMHALWNHFTKE